MARMDESSNEVRDLGRASALQKDNSYGAWAGDELERQERSQLRRVGGLSTELSDVTEVEYRQLRLERVVLVGLVESDMRAGEESLRELAALAETAGSQVLDGLLQRRPTPDPATYLGSGKAHELADIVRSLGADTVIVDGELAPSQRRALEDVVDAKVIDRTALILDIFAQHAKSSEGKAQVEYAQLEYLLPRLRGWGESMSRQAGGRVAGGEGIGSRGPGETKIELDRRRIRQRMSKLRKQIAHMKSSRDTRKHARRAGGVPSVVVVGYTNAGKSSLMNVLTGAGVLVENALFATLDPTVRKVHSPNGREYTLSDTVGFVRNLPTQLVEAFRSTLEEAGDADVLLHVVDGSHEDPVGQINAVREVLAGVEGAADTPELLVIAKADIASPVTLAALRSQFPGAVVVSAATGEGIEELKLRIEEALPRPQLLVDVLIPYDRGDIVSHIHEDGQILTEIHEAQGTRMRARVTPEIFGMLSEAGLVDDERGEVRP